MATDQSKGFDMTVCDMPRCNGPRQILLLEPAMRCVCRKCWRDMQWRATQ